MKLLKRTVLSILTVMFLTNFCPQAFAELDQEKLLNFSWEGVSLSMSPEEIYSSLEGDGYELTSEKDQRRGAIQSFYQRETDKTSSTVIIDEQDGVVTGIGFTEVRSKEEVWRQRAAKRKKAKEDRLANAGKKVKRKKNTQKTQNAQALDDKFSRIKSMLGIEDGTCGPKPNPNGGGKCSGSLRTDTHNSSFGINVNQRTTKVGLYSRPIAVARISPEMAARKEKTKGLLDSAYSCFGTIDATSAQEILDCIESSSSKLKGKGIRVSSPNVSCGFLTYFYKGALDHLQEDTSAIPGCQTFADVIELSTGKPPLWAGCMEPRDDAEFFKNCVGGYSPSLVSPKRFTLPSCNSLLHPYKKGIFGAQPDRMLRDIPVPDCDFVLSAAKTWRPELPASIKGCDGYDPNNTAEHLTKCLSSERELIYLKNCAHVRAAYKRNVTKANGMKPVEFSDVPCEETEGVLAKAEEVREIRRKKAEEFARKIAEAKQKANQQKQDKINVIKNRMSEKHKDTPEGIASRTSTLEKQIRANGGKVLKSCKSAPKAGLYCPPTNEEIRLAMMRRHAARTGFKIVNGHLIHGNQATVLTVLYAAAGEMGKATLGLELHYKEAQLIYDCDPKRTHYECTFRLPFDTNYDELTKMYMDGFTSGSSFNINDFIFALMDSAALGEDYSFEFRLDSSGLWRSRPTIGQRLDDIEDQIQDLNSKIW